MKIKIIPIMAGIPCTPVVVGGLIGLLSNMLITALVASTLIGYLYKKYFLRIYNNILDVNVGLPLSTQILIKGVNENIESVLIQSANDNKAAIIRCPRIKMLRQAITQFAYQISATIEFIDSNEFSIESKPLNDHVKLLSSKSKRDLQNKVNKLIERGGWQPLGFIDCESSLFDKVYNQTMIFNPKDC